MKKITQDPVSLSLYDDPTLPDESDPSKHSLPPHRPDEDPTTNGAPLKKNDQPFTLNPKFLVPSQTGTRAKTPRSFNNVAVENLPLYIPNATTPVVGVDGGINKAAVEVHKEKGLLIILFAYLDMAEFDFLQLFWGDDQNAVDSYTVTQNDIDNDRFITMRVPPGQIKEGIVNPVFIRVTRIGGGTAETKRLRLKVDQTHPAGIDPIASTSQNENLAKPEFPQHLIDFGVSGDDIGTPVPVTIRFYPVNTSQAASTYRAPRDRIRLSIGGVIVVHTVTEGEAAGQAPIVIMVNTSVWLNAGSGSHACEYQILDEAGNYSLGWSPVQIIDVVLDDGAEPLLPVAFFQEAPSNILDYDALMGGAAHVFVFINGNGYAIGDIIEVIVNGLTADGQKIVTTYCSPPLPSATAFFLTVPCANEDLKALVGGRLQLRYKRIRSGVPDRGSRSILVDVIGNTIPIGLLPPHVTEAIGDVIDPQLLFVNVVVREYTGQDRFDLVTLVLDGEYANGAPYYREYNDIAGDGDVLFMIINGPNGDIAALEGGTLRLYYHVANASGTRFSQDVLFNVGQPSASLVEPTVVQALPPDYQFDPEVWTGNANVRVSPDGDIKEGDTVVLYAKGNAAGGTAPPQSFPINLFWQGRELPFTLLRQYIIPNQTMRISYERQRTNAPTRFSHSVNMKIGSPLELPAPRVLESTDLIPGKTATLNPLHVTGTVVVFTVRVRYAMRNTDMIQPYFKGKPGEGTPTIAAKPGNASAGFVDFTVTNRAVAANLDSHVSVEYEVARDGNVLPSDALDLDIQPLALSSLNVVTVPESVGGEINPNLSNSVSVLEYPFMRAGQAFWIDLDGQTDLTLRNGTPVTAAEANNKHINAAIAQSYLLSLPEASAVEVKARVSLDGSGLIGSAVAFEVPRYNLKKTKGIIKNIAVGDTPQSAIFNADQSLIYICNFHGNSLSVINTQTNIVIRTIPGFTRPFRMALHPDNRRLFVGNYSNGTISVVDTNTHAIIQTITGLQTTWGIAFNPSGTRLYSATRGSSLVHVLDGNTGTYLTGLTVTEPRQLALAPGTPFLYVATDVGLTIIDTRGSSSIIDHIPIDTVGTGIAFTHRPGQNRKAYISHANGDRVSIYSLNDDRIIKTLTGFNVPFGVGINPVTERAYITEQRNNVVAVINTATDTVIEKIGGFVRPLDVAVTRDGQRAYVCNGDGSSVSLVEL